jgi:Putative prokaryotic signal transducing protein
VTTADVVRLTVVGNEGEAEIICSLLRTHGIACFARLTDPFGESVGEFGAWREILVRDDELEKARTLLAAS